VLFFISSKNSSRFPPVLKAAATIGLNFRVLGFRLLNNNAFISAWWSTIFVFTSSSVGFLPCIYLPGCARGLRDVSVELDRSEIRRRGWIIATRVSVLASACSLPFIDEVISIVLVCLLHLFRWLFFFIFNMVCVLGGLVPSAIVASLQFIHCEKLLDSFIRTASTKWPTKSNFECNNACLSVKLRSAPQLPVLRIVRGVMRYLGGYLSLGWGWCPLGSQSLLPQGYVGPALTPLSSLSVGRIVPFCARGRRSPSL